MTQTQRPHPTASPAARQRGLSIVELMIAMTLGLIILLGLTSLFVQTKQSFHQDELIARMQEDSRFAMTELQHDMAMAGFWADLLVPTSIQNVSLSGALYTYTTPIQVADNLATSVTLMGLALPDVKAGTDAIAIFKVAGSTTATVASGDVYLQTNGVAAYMAKGSNMPQAVPSPFNYWKYAPEIYYVRTYAVTSGDGIPTLCRMTMASAAMSTECIAEGIEDMQVSYGIDSDGDAFPDKYVTAPSTAQMQSVCAVRIYLLARSVDTDVNYTNGHTYTLSNSTIDPANPGDHYYRRVYNTTVKIRNNANLLRL